MYVVAIDRKHPNGAICGSGVAANAAGQLVGVDEHGRPECIFRSSPKSNMAAMQTPFIASIVLFFYAVLAVNRSVDFRNFMSALRLLSVCGHKLHFAGKMRW